MSVNEMIDGSVVEMPAGEQIKPNTKLFLHTESGRVGPSGDGMFVGYSTNNGITAKSGDPIDVAILFDLIDGIVYPWRLASE